MADQRRQEEKAKDPKPGKAASWMYAGEIYIDDGKGGYIGTDGRAKRMPAHFDRTPERRGQSGADRMAEIRERISGQTGDDQDALISRMAAGDMAVKPGSSGSGIALEDADEESSSSVNIAGQPNMTGPEGARLTSRRRLMGESAPLRTTGAVGTRESVRPSKRETSPTAEAPKTRKGSGSKARTTRSRG